MATLFEGVESILFPCTLIVLVPTLALVLATRDHRVALATGSLVGTSGVMWARAGGWWELESRGPIVVLIACVIVVAFVLTSTPSRTASTRTPAAVVGAGLLGGGVAGWLWIPCVGEEFADILSDARTSPIPSLIAMHVYVAGLLLPVLVVAALPLAFPTLSRAFDHVRLRVAAMAIGGVYALAVAIGRYDDLVGELVRMSST